MNTKSKAFVFIYRMQKKGLEIFLLNEMPQGKDWNLPIIDEFFIKDMGICLDPVTLNGHTFKAYALEEDANTKSSTLSILKNIKENGAFFSIKDCFKKMFPNQHAFLKELKEVMQEKNMVLNV